MGRYSVSLLVISLILFSFVLGAPGQAKQLGQEPLIRVYLAKNPKAFSLGATIGFTVNEYVSGKSLYSGKGELQCTFSDTESMSFSIFVETFYSRDDAINFAKALQPRFPVEQEVNIRSDGKYFRLEMGKYKSEKEAEDTLKKYFSDIPTAIVTGSIGLAIRIGDKLIFRPPTDRTLLNLVIVKPTDDGLVKFKGKRYRGEIILCMSGEKFYVTNRLKMEDYVKGVTPAEMPAKWPLEAVKAQAICARTYAFRYESSNPAYDICPTPECQVYIGYEHEHPNSNRAVDETRGEVATYAGKLIGTYFFSSSGGMTENSENVWVTPLPYLKGIESPGEEISPVHTWMKIFSVEDFSNRIKKAGKKDIGTVFAWRALERGVSPRVIEAEYTGTKGKVVLRKSKNQTYLGLKERWFDVLFIPNKVVVVGHGWGHGVGMSQYGAKARALEGKNYRQILKHYYTGIEITKWY